MNTFRITLREPLGLSGNYPTLLEAARAYINLRSIMDVDQLNIVKVEIYSTNDHGGYVPFDMENHLDGMRRLFTQS